MKTKAIVFDGTERDIKDYVNSLFYEKGFNGLIPNVHIFKKNETGVQVFIFSNKLNPLGDYPISFMNKGFKDLIQSSLGSLFWLDEDDKFIHFPKNDKDEDAIVWGSIMYCIEDEKLSEDAEVKEFLNLIKRIEERCEEELDIIPPQIVITFESCFLNRIPSEIINDFENLEDIWPIDNLYAVGMPFEMALYE